jgi:uncharacterized membrane protein YsdA (DUF1294 family)
MDKYMNLLWIYLAVVNCLLFVLMGVDKYKAIKGAWRIPEATLFILALIGGGIGGTFGMYSFRHKTRHLKFEIGFPVIAAVQCVLVGMLIKSL